MQFQSTLPVGGATWKKSLRGFRAIISIHAPRGGSDKTDCTEYKPYFGFQSTLPVGGATPRLSGSGKKRGISIHAPRGGSDGLKQQLLLYSPVISIHAPRGGSDWFVMDAKVNGVEFQSTLPVGGATFTA